MQRNRFVQINYSEPNGVEFETHKMPEQKIKELKLKCCSKGEKRGKKKEKNMSHKYNAVFVKRFYKPKKGGSQRKKKQE